MYCSAAAVAREGRMLCDGAPRMIDFAGVLVGVFLR
jgi:hypothetical protein